MFEKFRKWLDGEFVCIKCSEKKHFITFGFGECICPNCYDGKKFIKYDESYWLNRLLMTLSNYRNPW